jgi:cytochrome b pre-mRNA-processing protein 3
MTGAQAPNAIADANRAAAILIDSFSSAPAPAAGRCASLGGGRLQEPAAPDGAEIPFMLNILRRVAGEKRAAERLYGAIAEQARTPAFYARLGVADSFDGRFDLTVLHGWLVMEGLRKAGLNDLEQRLIQMLFVGFEEGLRDQGAGDMSIGRRAKAMTSAMFGRVKSYESAADENALIEALVRNLYRDTVDRTDCARAVAHYIQASRKTVAASDIAAGEVRFAPVPQALEKAG